MQIEFVIHKIPFILMGYFHKIPTIIDNDFTFFLFWVDKKKSGTKNRPAQCEYQPVISVRISFAKVMIMPPASVRKPLER